MAILRNVVLFLAAVFLNASAHAESVAPIVNTVSKSTVYILINQSGTQFGGTFLTLSAAASHAQSISVSCTTMLGWDGCNYSGSVGHCANMAAALTTGQALCRPSTRIPDGAAMTTAIGSAYNNGFKFDSTLGCVSPAVESGNNCVTTTCPAGGYTLSGGQCTRPDCAPGDTRDANGACVSACAALAAQPSVTAWYTFDMNDAGPGPGGYCGSNNCAVSLSLDLTGASGSEYFYTGTKKTLPMSKSYTGGTCAPGSQNAPGASTPAPPVPKKNPPCAATEGVLTSSSGTVACVPAGTPTATTPVVRKESQTTNYPDGSAKTVETTYTKDATTGVQSTTQKTTNTPATGGGAGQAGPVGTTQTGSGSTGGATSGDKPVAEPNDLCKNNPTLDLCTGKLNKEETQLQIRDGIKSLTDPAATPYTAIENAKQSTQADADLKAETDKFEAIMNGSVDPAASSKSSWQSAMESGWFSPIPATTCSPYTATIGGRTWTLDICPTAEKVATIAEYVMWFGLVVGVFVMFTGGAYVRNQ